MRTAKRAKRASHTRVPLPQSVRANQRWSMDFVSDRFADGRWFRILTVVDQYTRECLCTYADRSQTGEKVVEQMKRLVKLRGMPESIIWCRRIYSLRTDKPALAVVTDWEPTPQQAFLLLFSESRGGRWRPSGVAQIKPIRTPHPSADLD